MEKIGENLNKIHQYARKNNKVFVFVIAPDKVRVYGEKVGYLKSEFVLADSDIDRLVNHLRTHYDFPVIYARKALLARKLQSRYELYSRHDTHWREEGAYYGYYLPLLEVLALEPCKIEGWTSRTVQAKTGDLARMLSTLLPNETAAQTISVPIFAGEAPKRVEADDPHTTGKSILTYTDPTGNGLKLFSFRDSFSTAALPFLSRTFSKSTFVWRDALYESDLAAFKESDVIVLEMVERNIYSFPGIQFNTEL